MIVVIFFVIFAGCLSLALSQDRNWKNVAGRSASGRTHAAAHFLGWALLGASLAVCIVIEGPGFGVLTWVLQITVASFLVSMMLSFRPNALKPVVRAFSALWS